MAGQTLEAGWSVTYTRDGWSPFVLNGRTRATLDQEGRIAELVDSFSDSMTSELEAWMRENDAAVDPSYV